MTRTLGIDPGRTGGLALLEADGTATALKMPATAGELLAWLREHTGAQYAGTYDPKSAVATTELTREQVSIVVIERQEPRPTIWIDKKTKKPQRAILKSTVLLYGGYRELLGILSALGLRVEDVRPQAWQKAMGIPAKAGKPGLKRRAEQLFPDVKVTNWNADALLLAELGRRLLSKS